MVSSKLASRGEGRRIGRYELLCEVARGFFGALWVARDPSEDAEPALLLVRRIKIPPPKQKSVVEAAEWAGQLVDEHLIRSADVVVEGNQVDVFVPYIEGEPLRGLIRAAAFQREPLSHPVALRIALDILSQLDALHATASADIGAHFGGVQPDSLLVGVDGKTRLLDVGTATVASTIDPWRRDPQRSAYLAPEQLHSGTALDARCDVFVLGSLLWEMLANRRLFAGATDASIRDRIKKATAPRLDQLKSATVRPASPELALVVGRALQRNPERRFSSVAAFAAALRHVSEVADHAEVAAVVQRLAKVPIGKRRAALERSGVQSVSYDVLIIREFEPAPSEPVGDEEEAEEIEPDAELGLRPPPPKDRTPPPPPSRRTHAPRPSLPDARTAAPPSVRAPSAPPRPPSVLPRPPDETPSPPSAGGSRTPISQEPTPPVPAVVATRAARPADAKVEGAAGREDAVPDSQRATSVPEDAQAKEMLAAVARSRTSESEETPPPASLSSIPPRPSSAEVDESEVFDGDPAGSEPAPAEAGGEAAAREERPAAAAAALPEPAVADVAAAPDAPSGQPPIASPSWSSDVPAEFPEPAPSLAPPPVRGPLAPAPSAAGAADEEPVAGIPLTGVRVSKWVWIGAAAAAALVLIGIGLAMTGGDAHEATRPDDSPGVAAGPAQPKAKDTGAPIANAAASAQATAPAPAAPSSSGEEGPRDEGTERGAEVAEEPPKPAIAPAEEPAAPVATRKPPPPATKRAPRATHRPPPPAQGHSKPNATFKPGGI